MSKSILIQAINPLGHTIKGFRDVIKLYLNSTNEDAIVIACDEEKDNGIYVFHINDDIDVMSKVFVQLSQDKAIKEKADAHSNVITYLKKPYFLHPTCSQINILAVMLDNDKPVPYTFASYGSTPIIAIIKAYKMPTLSQEHYWHISDNTLQSYQQDWHNEIYTIDSTQTIRLQAFIGENTMTKTIKANIDDIDLSHIKWGYTIVSSKLQTSINNYPKINHKQHNITPLDNKIGTNITFHLSEITQEYKANANTFDNSGHNIIIFAYTKDLSERILHLDYYNTNNNRTTTIQCIELKILQNRFYLHYDGEILEYLENERVLYTAQETANKDIALFLKHYITPSLIHKTTATGDNSPLSAQDSHNRILKDGQYTISSDNTIFEVFHQAMLDSHLPQNLKETFNTFINAYKADLSTLHTLELIVAHNKDIIIEVQRYYEDINLTASRFRIRVQNENLLKCPKHKDKQHIESNAKNSTQLALDNRDSKHSTQNTHNQVSKQTIPSNDHTTASNTKEQDCKDCQALKDFTKWDNHYFLERSGYDSITPNLELRIPEGRYNVNWRYSGASLKPNGEFANLMQTKHIKITRKARKPLFNLNNKYILPQRAIMLHTGFSLSWTKGCLLFADALNPNDNKPETIIGSANAIDNQKLKQEEHSNAFANKILNFLIQDETIKHTFKQTNDDNIGLQIPNLSFVIRNKFEKIKQDKHNDEIPPNVIRIECEDGSDEFIEIILPEGKEIENLHDNETNTQIDKTHIDWKDIALNAALLTISSGKVKSKIQKQTNKSIKIKSLTRQEVLGIVKNLKKALKPDGKPKNNIYLVEDKQKLNKLWRGLTQNAKELPNGVDKLHNKPIYRRQLDDGTRINYRIDSKTGGETIDIHSKSPKKNIKIHIQKEQ